MTPEQLPRWTRLAYQALTDLPSTQLRGLAGIAAAELIVIFLLVSLWTGRTLDPQTLEYTLVFVGALNGFAVGQHALKRATEKTPPEEDDAK